MGDFMIEFILCDDNKRIIGNTTEIIEKIMIKNSHDYSIKVFNDYSHAFFEHIANPSGFRIYILDIEMPSESGIDVARTIRETDTNSIIIFLTVHAELGTALLNEELMFLTFINKLNNYKERIKSSIEKALEIIGKNSILRYSDPYGVYTIPLKDILYITHDSIDRKSTIKTSYAEFKLKMPLNTIKKMLNDDFIHSHRSCIVNLKQIRIFDIKKNEIHFCCGNKIDIVSNQFKKEVKKYEFV
jgi:DNA-binding LytR/AlgR family response regulator